VSLVFWLIVVLLILFFIIFLILITRLTVIVDLLHVGDDDHLKIKFRAWLGIIRYTISIPLIKVDDEANLIVKQEQKLGDENSNNKVKKGQEKITPEEEVRAISDVKEILQHVVGLHKIVRRFLKKVKVRELEWHSQIGIGDAAHTGMLTGLAWSIKGGVVGIISQYMQLHTTPVITITPEFNVYCSRTKLQCMIQFRIGHAMLAGIQLIKYWKGGRPKLKSKPFSFFAN
jgi:Protein of unknown function (DUF2953)